MVVFLKQFGPYQTNCYILKDNNKEIIIDPGEGSYSWVMDNVKDPRAILLTHGHFDHIYDATVLKRELKIPIFIHKLDAFMLRSDKDFCGYECCEADFMIDEGEYNFGGFKFKFLHFPGHTPGCCMIQIENLMFSGDFLFKESVGRWDFEYSSRSDMLKSLIKSKNLQGNFNMYPGHGSATTWEKEKENIDVYIRYVQKS
ncbi:metallo-beta-lactamase family protein [Campylobacter pinnipediorum subsp. caledonicus]|uniref:Metallo-beta-lactamase family protein n=1 Tax=Campylobacter pinnipediorum subsp. caledonicus TaxID=1874362 RepID=A0A1S6U6X9_9BACT|nr:MBL fold metallo-hydrolase [Campylobacter pinnipediorum]AQW87473.1 metallo-beta-lactamase family protein [Campylobacter pinnipediorum subsp. caledonicus]